MIFLMTGPATNTGTIAIIVSQFGSRFATIYVSSVIAVTVALGIVIDIILFRHWRDGSPVSRSLGVNDHSAHTMG